MVRIDPTTKILSLADVDSCFVSRIVRWTDEDVDT
jgi:hypothetical protein